MNAEIDLPGWGVVDVDYTQEPVTPARTWGDPLDCYPEEGGEIEIGLVTDENGSDISDVLTEEGWKYITDQLEHYND